MPAYDQGVRSDREASMSQLARFVEQHANSFSKFQLLSFLARHPNDSFDFLSLASTLWVTPSQLREALWTLLNSALVEKVDANGATLYCLSRNPQKRASVLALAELTWEQAQKLSRSCARHRLAVTPQFGKIAAQVR